MSALSRQEMYDRAVKGLASQGFQRSFESRVGCSYDDGTGKRCAWGWVDLDLDAGDRGKVAHLRNLGRGIAGTLSDADTLWANDLQGCHDQQTFPHQVKKALREFGIKCGLVLPPELNEEETQTP